MEGGCNQLDRKRKISVTLFRRMAAVEFDFPMKRENGQVNLWLRVIARSLTWKKLDSMTEFNARLFVETCKSYAQFNGRIALKKVTVKPTVIFHFR